MGSQPSPKETKTAYARLDSLRGVIDGRERVVCGQQNRDGRYVCSQDIGYVKVSYRGTLREYCLWPGWLRYDDGGWRPINYAVQQVRKGYRPKFRSDAITRSQGDHFGEPFQPGAIVHELPAVVYCCDGHRNVADPKALDAITEEEWASRILSRS